MLLLWINLISKYILIYIMENIDMKDLAQDVRIILILLKKYNFFYSDDILSILYE